VITMTSTLARPAERVTAWRLGGRARKAVLLLHIMAAGTWFGLDVAMAVLVFTAIFTESAEVTALRGEVAKAADVGIQLAAGVDLDWNFSNMLYPPIVSPTALTIAFLLAVFKPWGRIRRNRAGLRGTS
jgi:hypothetical protein